MDKDNSTIRQYATVLCSERITADNKKFFLDLKENGRGRFLKITEDVDGNRDTIVIPVSALEALEAALGKMISFNECAPN